MSTNWSERFTSEELAAALDYHAALIARHLGAVSIRGNAGDATGYEIADEIRCAAECIRDLQQNVDELRRAGGDLVRQVMAAKESLTSKPL